MAHGTFFAGPQKSPLKAGKAAFFATFGQSMVGPTDSRGK